MTHSIENTNTFFNAKVFVNAHQKPVHLEAKGEEAGALRLQKAHQNVPHSRTTCF